MLRRAKVHPTEAEDPLVAGTAADPLFQTAGMAAEAAAIAPVAITVAAATVTADITADRFSIFFPLGLTG